MKYCGHICAKDTESSLFQPWVQECFHSPVWVVNCIPPSSSPFHTDKMLLAYCLLYCHVHGRCLGELNSLASKAQTFTARTHHDTYTKSTYIYSFHIPLVKRKFHWDIFSGICYSVEWTSEKMLPLSQQPWPLEVEGQPSSILYYMHPLLPLLHHSLF